MVVSTLSRPQSPPSPASVMGWPPKNVAAKDSLPVKRKAQSRKSAVSELTISPRDLSFRNPSLASRSWRVTVGLAAFFDFSATILSSFIPKDGEFFRTGMTVTTQDRLFHDLLKWLVTWYVQIAAVFSLLWFLDAFGRAQRKRDKKLNDLDRKRVMESSESSQANVDLRSAWGAYYWTIGFQLLNLPVSFYIFLWHMLQRAVYPMKVLSDDREAYIMNGSDNGTHCLLFALLHHFTMFTNRIIGAGIQNQRKILNRCILRFAVFHPRQFVYRWRKFLRAVRWLKYLTPLMATSIKLLDNALDLLKKHRQHRLAKKAYRMRKKHWDELGPTSKGRWLPFDYRAVFAE